MILDIPSLPSGTVTMYIRLSSTNLKPLTDMNTDHRVTDTQFCMWVKNRQMMYCQPHCHMQVHLHTEYAERKDTQTNLWLCRLCFQLLPGHVHGLLGVSLRSLLLTAETKLAVFLLPLLVGVPAMRFILKICYRSHLAFTGAIYTTCPGGVWEAVTSLKQNKAQSTHAKSTHKGVN